MLELPTGKNPVDLLIKRRPMLFVFSSPVPCASGIKLNLFRTPYLVVLSSTQKSSKTPVVQLWSHLRGPTPDYLVSRHLCPGSGPGSLSRAGDLQTTSLLTNLLTFYNKFPSVHTLGPPFLSRPALPLSNIGRRRSSE